MNIQKVELANAPTRYKLRVADYVLLHEKGSFNGQETELVDGNVYVMSPEWRPHFRIKSELSYRLRRAVEEMKLPLFVGTEGSIALSDNDMPRPDILLTSEPAGEGPLPRESVPLLVEISSTTLDHDLGPKAIRYAVAKIPEYWVVDVSGRVLHQMWSPSDSGYAEHKPTSLDDRIDAATLAGLSIETSGL